MSPFFRTLTLCAVAAVLLTADSASACPMCKAAAEADPRLPKAFMASILFMLSMPFALLTCFGVGFYRLSKRGHAPVEGRAASSDVDGNGVI